MSQQPAVVAEGVSYRYGDRQALQDVGFEVQPGTAHGFLGPNGSGKSTLFRLLATLTPPQAGSVRILGLDLGREAAAIRRRLGVVFQSPAVDKKLTVQENLRYGGAMLGLGGHELAERIDVLLAAGRLADRAKDLVEELSGGLRRRVEIAKCMLGRPDVVLLDEASTGLDPAARGDMWALLRSQPALSILFTTHLMDEAAEADQLTLLDQGQVVAQGRPKDLMREVGSQVLEIEASDATALAADVQRDLGVQGQVVDGALRLDGATVHELVPQIMQRFGDRVQRLQLAHPSLQDVFLRKTGKRFVVAEPDTAPQKGRRRKK
ncbi:MAG: ABC transporter ATP-binding protein [Planctomycetes bacterium]|nr:ABC transporter ATP-binding protein [Planctomycetota bacterium]MCB9884250.1 ABC transporter ATP-binding protein [Planctomycetota bacterium]